MASTGIRLRSHWDFAGCSYRKVEFRCAEPDHIERRPVPGLPARKGGLAVAAVSLQLFARDVAGGDLVGWIDDRLAGADLGAGAPGRAATMREAILGPLCEVVGIGAKVWAMMLADLLLVGDPDRERWVTAGASMVAVDSLVHAFLHRTGALRHCYAEHSYGPACYATAGCAVLIEALAEMVDAREFDPTASVRCPRLVQHALWHFCAEGGWSVCNGRRIDDRGACQIRFCPAGSYCDRLSMRSPLASSNPG